MFKTDALSCPICEGKPLSNKHRCQVYYDNLLDNSQTTYTPNGVTRVFISPVVGQSPFGDLTSQIKTLQSEKSNLIELLELVLLHRDIEIFEVEIEELIKRIK